jgi:type IV secretion system protein VirD4
MDVIALLALWSKIGLGVGVGTLFTALAYSLTSDRNKLATGELGNKLSSGTDGIQLSKKYQLSKEASQAHIGAFAPTRAGKTTSLLIPNLLQNSLRGSIIIYDPSLEIYNATHKYQEHIGRKVFIYNPLEPGKTEYNMLSQCTHDREVVQLAQNLLVNGCLSLELPTGKKSGGTEWLQMASNLLAAVLFYARDRRMSLCEAVEWLIDNDEEEMEGVFIGKAERYFKAYLKGAGAQGMQGSIKGTMTSNLGLYLDNLAVKNTSFDAELLRSEECIIYITYPEHMGYYLAPLMAPMYGQLINKLIDIKGLDIWFKLDEFANLGQITGFNVTISTCAKRGISFELFLQDFNQLKQVYGHDNALTIWNNLKTKVVLPGISDAETLRLLSLLCDDEEITIQQEKAKVRTKKPLFTPGELRRIQKGKCVILSDNFQPIVDETNFYKTNPKYKEWI